MSLEILLCYVPFFAVSLMAGSCASSLSLMNTYLLQRRAHVAFTRTALDLWLSCDVIIQQKTLTSWKSLSATVVSSTIIMNQGIIFGKLWKSMRWTAMPLTDTTLREVTECKVLRNYSLVRKIDSIGVIVKSVYVIMTWPFIWKPDALVPKLASELVRE